VIVSNGLRFNSRHNRRAGIAALLARHVADTYAVAVHDLLHNPPFSDAGLAWAAALCAGWPIPVG